MKKKVIIESPYAGKIGRNITYARRAMHHSFSLNELPFASHLLYTQPHILNDKVPRDRALGIDAGLEWGKHADATVVYLDYGISQGMQYGIDQARKDNRPIEYRHIGKNPNYLVPIIFTVAAIMWLGMLVFLFSNHYYLIAALLWIVSFWTISIFTNNIK